MSQPDCYGRYEVKKVLGRGAMGVVYLAEDPVIGREVAIKVIQAHAGLEDQELEQLQARFEREFRSAGTLSHPNIVTIHDVGQEEDCSFIAMEFVRGEGLESIIAANRVLSFKEVADLTLQICDGLDFAHERGVVHRDIKPANIIITREGRPKITDFGIAKVTTTTLTRTGTVIGTPSYMSPEQVTGHPVTGAADQFSIAVLVYELFTGERPFVGDSPTTIMYKIVHEEPVRPKVLNARLPEALDRALLRALEKDPAQRYPTCTAFAEAVRDALGAAPADATVAVTDQNAATVLAADFAKMPVPEPAAPAKSRTPLIAAIAATALVIGALGLWAVMGRGGDEGQAQGESPVEQSDSAGVDPGPNTSATAPVAVGESDEPSLVDPSLAERGSVGDDEAGGGGGEDPANVPADPVPEAYTVTSQPEGAQVYMDGELQNGTTPVEIQILPGSEYQVRVEMDGYQTASWVFTDDDLNETHRSTRELLFNLEPSTPPGSLVLNNAPYPVAIVAQRLDDAGNPTGRPQSFAPEQSHEIELASGLYEVELSAPNVYFHRVDPVSIQPEISQTLTVPRAVNVRVMAYPANCRVSIDGRDHDSTPFFVLLALGDHEFGFDWSAVGEGEKTVTHTVTGEGQQILEQSGQR